MFKSLFSTSTEALDADGNLVPLAPLAPGENEPIDGSLPPNVNGSSIEKHEREDSKENAGGLANGTNAQTKASSYTLSAEGQQQPQPPKELTVENLESDFKRAYIVCGLGRGEEDRAEEASFLQAARFRGEWEGTSCHGQRR